MNSAIERLAAELMKLSDDEWTCATERWRAGLGWDEVFGAAWEEISERLSDVDRGAAAMAGAGDAHGSEAA